MDWATLALVSAAIFGFVSVLDKYIVDRLARNIRTILFIMGALSLLFCIPFFFADPSYSTYSLRAIGAAVASGLVRGLSLAMLFWVLRREEVSRALPVTQTYPIFVAILAALFLNERVGVLDWVAIVVIVGGAVVLSVRRAAGGLGGFLLGPSFFLLILSSFGAGLSNFLGKDALSELSTVQVFTINFFAVGVAILSVSTTRDSVREAWEMLRYRPRHMPLFVADTLLALLGSYLLFASFSSGPVSGASALNATRPLFVFIYVVIGSRLTPRLVYELLTPRILASKLTAITMIVGGTAALVVG
jgi:transporter family protein